MLIENVPFREATPMFLPVLLFLVALAANLFRSPSPPYLGPAAHTSTGNNRPIRRVVIHSTVSPTKAGGARAIAAYFRSSGSGGSAHYVVDPDEVVQVVYDGVIAWHAPPNPGSIGVELCEYPTWSLSRVFGGKLPRGVVEVADEDQRPDLDPGPGVSRVNVFKLLVPTHRRMYDRAAKLVAELCLAEGLPTRYVNAAGLKRDERGVTTHRQVSLAFGESDHWDPGAWPRHAFMRRVRKWEKQLRAEANQ